MGRPHTQNGLGADNIRYTVHIHARPRRAVGMHQRGQQTRRRPPHACSHETAPLHAPSVTGQIIREFSSTNLTAGGGRCCAIKNRTSKRERATKPADSWETDGLPTSPHNTDHTKYIQCRPKLVRWLSGLSAKQQHSIQRPMFSRFVVLHTRTFFHQRNIPTTHKRHNVHHTRSADCAKTQDSTDGWNGCRY